jgi:hypothetical protein
MFEEVPMEVISILPCLQAPEKVIHGCVDSKTNFSPFSNILFSDIFLRV